MRISEITVDSFGHWKGLRVPNVSSGVTVIHGPNEAGKSTLLQLIRAVLYGFSPEHHHRFVPALYEGRVGGTIHASAPNGAFKFDAGCQNRDGLRITKAASFRSSPSTVRYRAGIY